MPEILTSAEAREIARVLRPDLSEKLLHTQTLASGAQQRYEQIRHLITDGSALERAAISRKPPRERASGSTRRRRTRSGTSAEAAILRVLKDAPAAGLTKKEIAKAARLPVNIVDYRINVMRKDASKVRMTGTKQSARYHTGQGSMKAISPKADQRAGKNGHEKRATA